MSCIVWQTCEDLKDFMNSTAYGPYLRGLDIQSNNIPHTIVDLGLKQYKQRLKGWVSIHTLCFNEEISSEKRDTMMRMHGMIRPQVLQLGGAKSGVKHCIPVFVSSQNGSECRSDTAVVLHTWGSDVGEADFKQKYENNMVERWNQDLEELGPSSVLEEHCFLKRLFSEYPPEPEDSLNEDKSL